MASFFAPLTRTVPIDDQNTITLRAPKYGEMQEVNSRAMVVRVGMDGEGAATFDAGLLERLIFHMCITAWSGPGFDGLEPKPELIDQLPVWVLDKLKPAINELTKSMEDA